MTVALTWGQLCPPTPAGDIWQHLETFMVLIMCYWYLVEAKDAAKYPTMLRTVLHNKEQLAQNVNSAKTEKPQAIIKAMFCILRFSSQGMYISQTH